MNEKMLEMKKRYSAPLKMAITLCAAFAVLACRKDDPISATDPFPYPEANTAGRDYSVSPGDSFFDYCNGAWLAANPIPTDPTRVIGVVMNTDPWYELYNVTRDHKLYLPVERRAYIW